MVGSRGTHAREGREKEGDVHEDAKESLEFNTCSLCEDVQVSVSKVVQVSHTRHTRKQGSVRVHTWLCTCPRECISYSNTEQDVCRVYIYMCVYVCSDAKVSDSKVVEVKGTKVKEELS